MTIEEVQEIIRIQSELESTAHANHGMTLSEMLITPQKISMILRTIHSDVVKDNLEPTWLVGQENEPDGYSIVMSDDGSKFGLASKGFAHDEHLILTGWYGTLLDAFHAM